MRPKIIAFHIALRCALALHRFTSAVVDVVIGAPDDETFDAVHSMLERRKP